MKKFIVSFLIFGMFLVLSPASVKAVTVTDLYVQMQALQKQITNLQSQMSALALRAEVPTLSVVNQAPLSVAPPETSKDVIPVKIITPTPTPTPTLTTIPVIETALPISKLVTDKDVKSTDVNTAVKNINVVTDTKKINTEKIINTITKMTLGSKGSDVLALQKILIKKGLLKKELATGYYGTATLAAVSSFQKANGLTEDGVAGKGTIAKLNSLTESLTTNPCDNSPVDINGNHAPSITVLSPNGGEVFNPGQQITVKWQSCNVSANENMLIEMTRANIINQPISSWIVLSSATPNDGIQTFTLNSNIVPGTYELAVKGNLADDLSDGLFNISATTPPTSSITVTSPNGGESYAPGQTVTVTWTSQGIPATNNNVAINLKAYDSNGVELSNTLGLAVTTLNDGTETLQIPAYVGNFFTLGNHFKVSVGTVDSSNNILGSDTSDNLFTINNTATALNIDSHISSTSFISSTSTKTENPGIKNDLGNFSMTFNVTAADGDIYLPKVVSFSTLVNGIFLNINTPSGGLETSGVNGVITCITNCATSSSGNNFVVQDGNTATFKVSAIVDNSSTMHGQAFYRLSLAAIPWNINNSGTFHLYAPVNVQNYVTQSINLD